MKDYKRFPIQISAQNIMLIHLFNDIGSGLPHACENMDMREENPAVWDYDMKIHETAAKQFFDQLEGHYCDAFLEELILESTRRLKESDARRKEWQDKLKKEDSCSKFENRAQKALDKAAKL